MIYKNWFQEEREGELHDIYQESINKLDDEIVIYEESCPVE